MVIWSLLPTSPVSMPKASTTLPNEYRLSSAVAAHSTTATTAGRTGGLARIAAKATAAPTSLRANTIHDIALSPAA